MRVYFKFFLSICFLSLTFLSYKIYSEENAMFSVKTLAPREIKNLKDVEFPEKNDIRNKAAELAAAANDPYAASLPMMISAELGDAKEYLNNRRQMVQLLNELDESTDPKWKWMQNNSFKAWMWGRILLAAQSIGDYGQVQSAKNTLAHLLQTKPTEVDNLAFTAWAWGYRAALNRSQYHASKKIMMDDAQALADKYQQSGKNSDLSDELWGWVMNIQAAARANDKATYEKIKSKIAGKEGEALPAEIALALNKGLSHTAASNDYPAWALAKVRLAAAMMGDDKLFIGLAEPLAISIAEANKIGTPGAKAEYSFAVLDNELAKIIGKDLEPKQQISYHV